MSNVFALGRFLPLLALRTDVILPVRMSLAAWSQWAVSLSVRCRALPLGFRFFVFPARVRADTLVLSGVSVHDGFALGGGFEMNVAVTLLSELIVTLHVPVPEQAPLQPWKVDAALAAAVKETAVPAG